MVQHTVVPSFDFYLIHTTLLRDKKMQSSDRKLCDWQKVELSGGSPLSIRPFKRLPFTWHVTMVDRGELRLFKCVYGQGKDKMGKQKNMSHL